MVVDKAYQELIEGSDSISSQARLKGATGSCSGAWLEATPIVALGTKLEDEAVRIAVSLRLGCNICVPHTCRCSAEVRSDGLHGLDCERSSGRHARHSELNTIVHRSLSSIGRPSFLEPCGMTRQDGRRPDRVPLFPWKQGKPLVWDVTCMSTLARSNLQHSTISPGGAAAQAEVNKRLKYSDLADYWRLGPFNIAVCQRAWHPPH